MCGRFTQTTKPKQIKKEFDAKVSNDKLFKPRYNIAPTQMIPAILESDGERLVSELRWGLIPFWAKDKTIGSKLINARAETISEKPSFKNAFRSRRCVISASGFYEWQRVEKGAKQPFYFRLKDKDIFAFAGLWEQWLDKGTGEAIKTCTIITTEANEVLKPIHDRMPVILQPKDYTQWLDEKEHDTEMLQKLLVPFPAKEMISHAVSRTVNSPTSDSAELIKTACK